MIRVLFMLIRGLLNLMISIWLGITTPILELLRLAHKQDFDIDIGSVNPDYSLPEALEQRHEPDKSPGQDQADSTAKKKDHNDAD